MEYEQFMELPHDEARKLAIGRAVEFATENTPKLGELMQAGTAALRAEDFAAAATLFGAADDIITRCHVGAMLAAECDSMDRSRKFREAATPTTALGLDMYLFRKTYVKNWDHMGPERRTTVTAVHEDGSAVPDFDPAKVAYLVEQVGYWRKANAIHRFFVQEVQGGTDECQESYVPADKLIELDKRVKSVLADRSLAPEILPVQSGFFFGSTDYDEWYFEDLELTRDILAEIMPTLQRCDYYYQASW